MKEYICIDIGGTSIKHVCVVRERTEPLLFQEKCPHRPWNMAARDYGKSKEDR